MHLLFTGIMLQSHKVILTLEQPVMSEHTITIHLMAHMKEKAGASQIKLRAPRGCSVKDLKHLLKMHYPALGPQLANVVVLINQHNIFLDEDILPEEADVTFLAPIAGG